MKSLPVVDNSQIEGNISDVYIGPSFYFMRKKGKLFVIVSLAFTLHYSKLFS